MIPLCPICDDGSTEALVEIRCDTPGCSRAERLCSAHAFTAKCRRHRWDHRQDLLRDLRRGLGLEPFFDDHKHDADAYTMGPRE
jgi:hypothetical protein